jgi:hypothetical protein
LDVEAAAYVQLGTPNSKPVAEPEGLAPCPLKGPAQPATRPAWQQAAKVVRKAAAKRAHVQEDRSRSREPANEAAVSRASAAQSLKNLVQALQFTLPACCLCEGCHVCDSRCLLNATSCLTGLAAQRASDSEQGKECSPSPLRQQDAAATPRRIPSRLQPWACQRCTLDNSGALAQCGACNAARPSGSTRGDHVCMPSHVKLGCKLL